jgi:hypothetical protein
VGGAGTILHWNGQVWSVVASPVSDDLMSIDMLAENDGWAISFSLARVLHWDGNAWTIVSGPLTEFLTGLSMVSATDGWAVGTYEICGLQCYWQGVIFHWDAQWPVCVDGGFLTDVDMPSANDGWITGSYGAIWHWDGSNWSYVNSNTEGDLLSVASMPGGTAWATGAGLMLRWNEGQWSSGSDHTYGALNAVDSLTSDDAWAVGSDGVTMHWDGTA